MSEKVKLLLDNEYVIMSEVADNEYVTQRELSRKLGVSVSTVNVLMNKMIREGFIKMTQVSQKQVLYMLTPVGLMEKAKKTVSYLKGHYKAIYETKEKIKDYLDKLNKENDIIYVLMDNDEMSEILDISVQEYQAKHSEANIKMIYSLVDADVKGYKSPILLHMNTDEDGMNERMIDTDKSSKDIIVNKDENYRGLKIVNLAEIL